MTDNQGFKIIEVTGVEDSLGGDYSISYPDGSTARYTWDYICGGSKSMLPIAVLRGLGYEISNGVNK